MSNPFFITDLKKTMPKDSSDSNSQSNGDSGNAPQKQRGAGLFTLHTYSDGTYYAHIGKVLLILLVILGIAAFVIVGFFYPECNSTQDRGFYSCSCKPGSALDLTTGYCMCLDTASTAASAGCSNYIANEQRYVFADNTDANAEAEFGGWSKSSDLCN